MYVIASSLSEMVKIGNTRILNPGGTLQLKIRGGGLARQFGV